MILVGLILGRWWPVAIGVAAVGWPTLLLSEGIIGGGEVFGASLLGAANAAVGALIVQGLLRGYHHLRHSSN